jgi:hypothetical protein
MFLEIIKSYIAFFRYKNLWLGLSILMAIVLLPIHLLFLVLVIIYFIVYFLITIARVPTDFIKVTIEDNKEYHPAVQVVVFLIAYPSKFLFDFITSIQLVSLAWIFFLLEVVGYIGSLGYFKFQPFLMHAEKPKSQFR